MSQNNGETVATTVLDYHNGGFMETWYEVESLFFSSREWENVFHIDDQVARFNTLEDARKFLDEHLADELEAYNNGNLDDLTEADDYRIVKITKEVI